MKMRDCALIAAFLTNQTEEYETLNGTENLAGEAMENVQRNIETLVRCGNLVISEIASAYLLLKKKETVDTDSDGCIFYSSLSERPAFIYAAKSGDKSVKYREFPDRIEVQKNGKIDLVYAYLPASLSLDDELPFGALICERTIAYGIASEYYLISGQSDEAVVWDKRYRDSLHNSMLKRGEIKLKQNRWLNA